MHTISCNYIVYKIILCNTIEHLRLGHLPLLPTVFPVWPTMVWKRCLIFSPAVSQIIDFSNIHPKFEISMPWLQLLILKGILQIHCSPSSDGRTSKHMGHCKASPNSCHVGNRNSFRIIQCFISTNTPKNPLKNGVEHDHQMISQKKLHGSKHHGIEKSNLWCSKD